MKWFVDQAVLVTARREVSSGREGQRTVTIEQDNGVMTLPGQADQVNQFPFALAAAGRAHDETRHLWMGAEEEGDEPVTEELEPVGHDREYTERCEGSTC